jgi:glucose-6-phosphate isomerase
MPALVILTTIIVVAFESLVQLRYGAMSAIGLLLIAIGAKAKSPAVAGAGALVLLVTATGPGS